MRLSKHGIRFFNPISRRDYQEILLARMAAGDLYAAEEYKEVKRVDMLFDRFRDRPLYPKKKKTMGKQYKTFEDLVFEPLGYHDLHPAYSDGREASLKFENGYEVHVVCCSQFFYSNGKDTYEAATLYTYTDVHGKPNELISDVQGYLTADGVTRYMKQVQEYK